MLVEEGDVQQTDDRAMVLAPPVEPHVQGCQAAVGSKVEECGSILERSRVGVRKVEGISDEVDEVETVLDDMLVAKLECVVGVAGRREVSGEERG